MQPDFIERLHHRLMELGCPVRQVRRLVREVAEHREDLKQAALLDGLSGDAVETQVNATLGDPFYLAEHQMAMLETPGGQRWRLRTDALDIQIVRSIYWGGRAVPQDTLQIVLSGAADPMGHGLAPPNRVRWALARSS